MTYSGDPSFKIKAEYSVSKQGWIIKGTIENTSDKIPRAVSVDDQGNTVFEPLGLRLLSMIKLTEEAFMGDGRHIVPTSKNNKPGMGTPAPKRAPKKGDLP